jgi:uncharacterized protein (DUF433 family)
MTKMEIEAAVKPEAIRACLSFKEATMLADVEEGAVRKDIERKVIRPIKCNSNRLFFRWPDVYVMAAVYRHDRFNRVTRKQIVDEIEGLVAFEHRKERYLRTFHPREYPRFLHLHPSECIWDLKIKVDSHLTISMRAVKSEVAPAVDLYARGLGKIEEQEGIFGGEAVFKGTRLPVRHIGKLRSRGEAIEDIKLDYHYLEEDDIEFADMYSRANPVIGRPRDSRGGTDVGVTS